MKCKYLFKGPDGKYTGESKTYEELVTIFQSTPNLLSTTDIVFSRSEVELEQDAIYKKLMDLKVEGFYEASPSYFDGEPIISSNDTISPQLFIDTDDFSYRGKKLIPKMVRESYISATVAELMSEDSNLSEEDAKAIAEKEVEKWDIIGEDAMILHQLLSKIDTRQVTASKGLFQGTKFESVAGALIATLDAFKKRELGRILRENRNIPSKVITNINLKAEIEEIAKTLLGHIDMLVIDGSGDLHIYNYKITTSTLTERSPKIEKYKYQMALIKQILASHGFKVRNIKLNLVPIRVRYDETKADFTTISEVKVSENPIELTVKNNKYVFNKYDEVAKHFIKSTLNTSRISSSDLDSVNTQLRTIFPQRDIDSYGIKMTALEWIRKNRSKIIDSNNPEYAYEVYFSDDKKVLIKERSKPEENDELLDHILKQQGLLDTQDDVVLERLFKAIRGGMKGGFSFIGNKDYAKVGYYLNTVFGKYFPQSKDEASEWEFQENDVLNGVGIVLFKHKKTNQLDVIVLSSKDLNIKAKFKHDNIVGGLISNTGLNLIQASQLINYKSTYGNIEAVRAMLLLNQVLPKLDGDFELGKLLVLSLQGSGQGIPFSFELFNRECFSSIVKVAKKYQVPINNNFSRYRFVNRFDVLVKEFDAISRDLKISDSEERDLIETGFGNFTNAETIEAKLNALRQIEEGLTRAFPQLANIDIKNAPLNMSNRKIGLLYLRIIDAIAYYDVGEISTVESKISSMDRNVFVSDRIPNRNFHVISTLYTRAINNIAEQAENKWISIRKILYKFYDDIGYSRLQNSTLGGQASQFNDLYRYDSKGNRLLRLLNPYDVHDMAQIQKHRDIKREFLKKILFEFAKIRYPMLGIKFKFKNENDPELLKFILDHGDTYFNIPLEKASDSTRRLNLSIRELASYLIERGIQLLKNPKQAVEWFVNKVDSLEEQQLREDCYQAWQLQNKFIIGEGSGRDNYIAQHGVDYFETNLENLLADFIERDIETKEYNKALVTIKGVLFLLELLGQNPNLKNVVEQTIKMIEEFVKVNIFNQSIMDETSLKIVGLTTPLRRLVSNTLIAGNVIASLRDTFEGVWQNTTRVITKYQTDIDSASLAKAYQTVVANAFKDGRSINIVNQLCQMYRLSNIDVSRISEGLKSERGITNYEDFMYATLRRPDFLNRMTLFVAKCYKDGVYNAFSIKDGQLVYNWKQDKRFSIYASGNKNHKEYYNLMGAYFNAIRAYNKDHPEATIELTDDLPMPYSFQEVETMKKVANSIYGSYDKSTRANYEHLALGTFLGMFSTWMNGIYTNYMMKPGQYNNGEFQLIQATDDSGNPIFFMLDGQQIVQIKDNNDIKYYYLGTDIEVKDVKNILPVMDKVPIVVLGIWYTVTDSLKALTQGNFKEEIWLDPVLRKNLDKLFSDLLAWLIFGSIYKFALDPAYKDFKKGMKDRDIITNATVELLYKSSSRSYDGFRGIFNVFEYLGENTNPPIYSQNIKLLKETMAVPFTDRTFTDALNGNVAIFKSFQDTWRAYDKSQEKK